MKKVRRLYTILLLIIFSAAMLSGCTLAVNGDQAYSCEKPAIGFTVEDEVITDVKLDQQNSLNLEVQDGIIEISQWDRDYLLIIEKRKLTGPSKRESLKALLKEKPLVQKNTYFNIKLEKEPDGDLKAFFRRTVDIKLMVPKSLKTLYINAKSGAILMSGFHDLSKVSLELEKGSIKVNQCKSAFMDVTITEGDLDLERIDGLGKYSCGRGDIKLLDISGNIELKSVSGDTTIENAEGKLNCDISTGSITVKASRLMADTLLYASYGDINADMEGLEASGRYIIKASKGDIRLNMPEKTGWSLLAKSTKGRIVDTLGLTPGELKKPSSGQAYGDVNGGGPIIDVYVDRGDIYLVNAACSAYS